MRISQVEHLPIPRIAFATPADERERRVNEGWSLADQAARSGGFPSYSAFLGAPIGRWLNDRLAADPEQSDVVHDLLARLAQEMIRMSRERREEIEDFLAWLEREIGARLEDLGGHTRLRAYPGDERRGEPPLTLEELLEILRRNRRRLKGNPDARAFQKQLREEYEASLAKLQPLGKRLAAMDRLIDFIVYRLYGLTAEEAEVVEQALAGKGS